MKYLIYKHTSKTSGKSYVGFTKKTIEERFYVHIRLSKNGSNTHFHRALRKYGTDDFITELIEETDNKLREIYWIGYYDTFKNGYNMTKGGDGGNTSSKMTPERYKQYCENLSKANKGRKRTKEENDKMSEIKLKNPTRFPGSTNPRALKINIYNDENELMFECFGNLRKICSENNLPFSAARKSYWNNTTFYSSENNHGIHKKNLKYRNWYAKRLVGNE